MCCLFLIIKGGMASSCVITGQDHVRSWRAQICGQIGLCFICCRVTAIAAGLNHTAALTVGGDLLMCGHNKHGALGLGDTLNRFLPVKVHFLLLQPSLDLLILWQCSSLACSNVHGDCIGHMWLP